MGPWVTSPWNHFTLESPWLSHHAIDGFWLDGTLAYAGVLLDGDVTDGDPSFLRSGGLLKLLEMKSLLCEVLFRVYDGPGRGSVSSGVRGMNQFKLIDLVSTFYFP